MADRTGQTLGHYRLVRLLGQGGFAEVYLGEHIHLGTEAAIKLLHTQLASEDTDAFRREARTIARLVHPHIVRVFDFGIEGETPYLVMDYAPNGTVRKQHPKGVALPLPIILSYVKQTASALQYAHDEHFIHRDVKPENLLVGRRREILLGDFGTALLAQTSRSQSMQDVVGTASYMAPEQFQGKPRPASDQYALAVMVYEWLTGACPFHGSFTELASQHLFMPPPPLQGRTPAISPAVEQVVLTALTKDPHQRFSSVQAFATAFEQACQLETSPTRPSSQSLSPTEAMPQPRPVLSPTELAIPPSESVIPTELITPPSQSFIPTEPSALRSQTEGPPALVTPPSQASLPSMPPKAPPISRRAVLIGVAGAVVAIAVIGTDFFLTTHQQSPLTTPTPRATVPPHHQFTYLGHSDAVAQIAWSPDGKRIASSSSDKTVQVWSTNDGSNMFTYRGHASATRAVAWLQDGKRIASGSEDKTVQVWNANDGSNVFTYRGHTDKVWSVAWSPDGKRIASCSDDTTVQVWNANDGSNVFTYRGHINAARSVAWSPDGQRIVSGSWDATVQVWNANDGSKAFIYREHTDQVKTVAWSPNGQWIASGSADKTARVWNASNGREVFTYLGHNNTVSSVAWSPDGQRIASGSWDKTTQVWYVV